MTETTKPETGFVAVNGTSVYYEVTGDGHPLVLLHGGYMDRRMWDDQFAVFAEHYRVICYDIRGFGKTGMPQVPYSDVQDLYELLNHLQIEKTNLLGLSLGGVIAIDFTLEHPEMVDALMEDPTLFPSSKYPAARQRVRNNLLDYSFAWVLDSAPKKELDPPAYERLKEIHVPTLIMLGAEDDRRLFKDADRLERDIENAERVMIAETHHMPNMEKPEEFNTIVQDFLSKLLL
jgi:pimeloyl-ACP methyl ester carboxylesterase